MLIFDHIVPLDISTTIIGFTWTAVTIYLLLTEKGRALLSSYKTVGIFFILLTLTLLKVFSEISLIQQLSNGLKILDARFGYSTDDILAFGNSLGVSGREKYAAFQFGIDTCAPPAFACFVSSVAFTVLPRKSAINFLKLVFIYLFCVVLANALMPVVMLNFEYINYPFISFIFKIVPWLDFLKYLFHFFAWLYIIISYLQFIKSGIKKVVEN